MSGPVLHHRALGIHPASFVGPNRPLTADVQDGVLWVDTSSGPPYQLWLWDALAALWRPIGSVAPADDDADSCCGVLIPTPDPIGTGSAIVNLGSRCGAATKMADYLELYYSRVTNILKYGLGFALGAGIATALDVLTTALTAGLEIPFLTLVQPFVYRTAQFIAGLAVSGALASAFPALDSSDNATILEGIYKSLPTDGGPIAVTATTLAAWQSFITTNTMPCGSLAQRLLSFLISCVSLGSWQELAYFGAQDPKGSCAGWSLLGTAFQGGATLGVVIEQSFQGGATLGVAIENSFQGGAALA